MIWAVLQQYTSHTHTHTHTPHTPHTPHTRRHMCVGTDLYSLYWASWLGCLCCIRGGYLECGGFRLCERGGMQGASQPASQPASQLAACQWEGGREVHRSLRTHAHACPSAHHACRHPSYKAHRSHAAECQVYMPSLPHSMSTAREVLNS